MTLFDTNAWIGEWPFATLPQRDAAALRKHWRLHGIAGGLVSSFATVWPVDPMPGNRALQAELARRTGAYALPVLNPGAPGWEAHLEEIDTWADVPAVRLLPAYHAYRLNSPAAREAAKAIAATGRRVVLTMRLLDERHEHAQLKIKPPALKQVAAWLEAIDGPAVLLHGLTRWDIEALKPQSGRFAADLSFAEWEDTLGVVGAVMERKYMMFGSLTPLHVTRAQVDKVTASPAGATMRRLVADGNARKFFKL
ncbi:hypothetical protein [Synoicihabitans lomoniglobus]|uniref:Amidohydrolase-related domain-containing protein n=1 Tax=Synoicihabitans lomoniglobus TaxID=2909285 RepID=A0AAF0I394_9BACT|nr:hypothetical protein [Opitutaceae bacterium LMO-M01]WED66987.1 hypothetical protein PXH66_09005 [Opitutaceae bacterium LMO-M01]